jgi:hypothetical protein
MKRKSFEILSSMLRSIEDSTEIFATFGETRVAVSLSGRNTDRKEEVEFHFTSLNTSHGVLLAGNAKYDVFVAPAPKEWQEQEYAEMFSACPFKGLLPACLIGERTRELYRLLGENFPESGGLVYVAAQHTGPACTPLSSSKIEVEVPAEA